MLRSFYNDNCINSKEVRPSHLCKESNYCQSDFNYSGITRITGEMKTLTIESLIGFDFNAIFKVVRSQNFKALIFNDDMKCNQFVMVLIVVSFVI